MLNRTRLPRCLVLTGNLWTGTFWIADRFVQLYQRAKELALMTELGLAYCNLIEPAI